MEWYKFQKLNCCIIIKFEHSMDSKITKLSLLVLGLASFGLSGLTEADFGHSNIVVPTSIGGSGSIAQHHRQKEGQQSIQGLNQQWSKAWDNATPEQKAQREAKRKEWHDKHANQTPEEKAQRKAKRQAWLKEWENATPEQKAHRQAHLKAWNEKHKNQTPEQKAQREAKRKAWHQEWKKLTPEEKAHRQQLIKQEKQNKQGHHKVQGNQNSHLRTDQPLAPTYIEAYPIKN